MTVELKQFLVSNQGDYEVKLKYPDGRVITVLVPEEPWDIENPTFGLNIRSK